MDPISIWKKIGCTASLPLTRVTRPQRRTCDRDSPPRLKRSDGGDNWREDGEVEILGSPSSDIAVVREPFSASETVVPQSICVLLGDSLFNSIDPPPKGRGACVRGGRTTDDGFCEGETKGSR
ncbi:unnamed protein product [Linum trigynum]|uniref:Uncharacterized protein n=1 Tax=Linum trigynum TaxID=586398 RepID=A0AAV2DFJ2_9ROSI